MIDGQTFACEKYNVNATFKKDQILRSWSAASAGGFALAVLCLDH